MLVYVHMGPPCGTASRAREIRASRSSHGPPPLRSTQFPEGLPRLTGPNKTRVDQANRLIAFMPWWPWFGACAMNAASWSPWKIPHVPCFGAQAFGQPFTMTLICPSITQISKPVLMVDIGLDGLGSRPIFLKLQHCASNVMGNMATYLGAWSTQLQALPFRLQWRLPTLVACVMPSPTSSLIACSALE